MAHTIFTFAFLSMLFSQSVFAMEVKKERAQDNCQALLKACMDAHKNATTGPQDADKYNTCHTECKKLIQTLNCAKEDRDTAQVRSLQCRTEWKAKSNSKNNSKR